jgi:hypothetical protein
MRKIAGIILMAFSLYSCQKSDVTNNSITPPVNPTSPPVIPGAPVLPDSSLTRIYNVDSNSADADVAWISDPQVSPITSRGIVWNTAPNPTVDLTSKTDVGDNIGGYSMVMTGLLPNTTYYVREYATNANGTTYGVQKSFITGDIFHGVAIGNIYAGRLIFYILKPGDATYDPTTLHGFVAYLGQDTIYNAQPWDASGQNLLFWGNDTFIQSGASNTTNIVYQQNFEQGARFSAAFYCASAFNDVGYAAQGYLPSKDELNQLYLYAGPGAPGAHTNTLKLKPVIYWSSSQYDSTDAYWQNFADGSVGHGPKSDLHAVIPIMMF